MFPGLGTRPTFRFWAWLAAGLGLVNRFGIFIVRRKIIFLLIILVLMISMTVHLEIFRG